MVATPGSAPAACTSSVRRRRLPFGLKHLSRPAKVSPMTFAVPPGTDIRVAGVATMIGLARNRPEKRLC
jgi:hypothetical protein